MNEIHSISETVYVGMCCIVGTSTQVSLRREVVDIAEIIRTPVEKNLGQIKTLSGSLREGFGRAASDVDFMVYPSDHHVIWDLNQANRYTTERCALILMEYSGDRPGFTMLKLLTPTNDAVVAQSCARINDGLYIFSAKYRESTLTLHLRDSIQHGPCASGRIIEMEYDFAYCFVCKPWPIFASCFTLRCQSYEWPSNHVLEDIINSGCHVVPIGFKGSPQEDCEWRISFSLAERKLVHCMNHTQFLCYGLLKLFLKEVLTVKDINLQPLLCSYFMKTVLFWVIKKNTIVHWNPSSLLSGFWLCFKFLFACVCHGYLPNFFIPENNIFRCKVYGYSRQVLFKRLFDLYKLGISCLLHCHPLRHCLIATICNIHILIQSNIILLESDIISEYEIDSELFSEIHYLSNSFCVVPNIGQCFTSLQLAVRYLHASSISFRQHISLRKFISSILNYIVYLLNNAPNSLYNKNRLRFMYAGLKLSKVSAEMGCISDKIYLCSHLYSVGKIRDAITILTMMKRILKQPYVMYVFVKVGSQVHRYIDEVGRFTLSEKMKRAVVMNIRLDHIIIKELELEHRIISSQFVILIPPYAMTLILLDLCHRGNPYKQQTALYELYTFLHCYQEMYVPPFLLDISWHILGICQQICGDHQGTFLSYRNSLNQIHVPFNRMKDVTYHRIQDIQCRRS